MRAAAFVTFALAFLTALALRWPVASHDVEHYVGPDEGEVVENVLEMVKTGDFDHRHRGYPGLHFYMQTIPVQARLFVTGQNIAELPRSDFYRAARRTTLVAGLLSGAVLFAVGLRFLAPWASVLAAGLVLFSPLGFRESAVVNPDLMLSLFTTLTLFFSIRLLDDRSWRGFLVAGASVGLATAIKYTGGFAIASYALGFLLGGEPRRHRGKAAAGVLAAAVAFAASSPYTIVYLPDFFRGLGTHVAYYQASEASALFEIAKVVLTRGLGIVAAVAAFAGGVFALGTREPRRLIVLGFPLLYFLVFAFFDRAFPRHALPVLPALALLAADVCDRVRPPRLSLVLGFLMLAGPLVSTMELSRRAARPTPVARAAAWASAELPTGSRVLQDQFTPKLDPERFFVHRIRVDEHVFSGNFDWVFHSGYPPGLETEGLRERARFETDGALGDPVTVFQVPPRESLMGVTLSEGQEAAELGAGEYPFFGEGWEPPGPGAFGTERLSREEISEIFFVLPLRGESDPLRLELTMACAVCPVAVAFELNDSEVARTDLANQEPVLVAIAGLSKPGLNRLRLRYASTGRLDRRHRTAAVRFYRMRLSRS